MRPLRLGSTDAPPPSTIGPIGTVGVISDTHGLLRPEAVEALHGSELILHAGDVGDPLLEALEVIAPVVAVRDDSASPSLWPHWISAGARQTPASSTFLCRRRGSPEKQPHGRALG